MALDYGTDVFVLLPGKRMSLSTIFNSNSFKAGGDYLSADKAGFVVHFFHD
ncbi:MAG TPA: hypothetical protein VFK05_07105 [Polyangiaceae bacterium]|nr:hypothetical protein [Polyangiaceae bacterium]